MARINIDVANLTHDPQVLTNGSVLLKVAENQKWESNGVQQSHTDFYDVFVAAGKTANNVAASLRKGHAISVEGFIRVEEWSKDGKSGINQKISQARVAPHFGWQTVEVSKVSTTPAPVAPAAQGDNTMALLQGLMASLAAQQAPTPAPAPQVQEAPAPESVAAQVPADVAAALAAIVANA